MKLNAAAQLPLLADLNENIIHTQKSSARLSAYLQELEVIYLKLLASLAPHYNPIQVLKESLVV